MVERGRGTILFTGCAASLSGAAGFSELCAQPCIPYTYNILVSNHRSKYCLHVCHVIFVEKKYHIHDEYLVKEFISNSLINDH